MQAREAKDYQPRAAAFSARVTVMKRDHLRSVRRYKYTSSAITFFRRCAHGILPAS